MPKSTLVLLHGFPLDSRMWQSVEKELACDYDLLIPDFPGFGGTPLLSENSIPHWARHLDSLLNDAGVSGKIQLCGLSMGGYVALEFATLFPGRLQRLILCDTKATADTEPARQQRLQTAQRMRAATGEQITVCLQELVAGMLPKLLAPATFELQAEIPQQLESWILQAEPLSVAVAQEAMAHRREHSELLKSLTCPVLGIVGADDQLTPPQVLGASINSARQGKLVVIPQAGHMPPLEQPRAFVEAICSG